MQTIKVKAKAQKSKATGKALAVSAMFAALITVTTAFIKIPAPMGYAHAGDSMVYLTANVLLAPFSFIAAAIGGALADIMSGYAVWAIPTAIIKALNVLPFFLVRLILSKNNKDDKILRLPIIAALIATTAVTVGGYFIANALLYDVSAAIAETPFNIMQSIVGAVLFAALAAALDAVKFKQHILK